MTTILSGPKPRLLLVEDSDDTRALLAVVLGNDGWVVDQAADAFQGLDHLRHARYDLLIADYTLPDKSGAAMILEASADGLLADTRVLVITAHPNPEGMDEVDVIRKPLDLPSFVEQVRRIRDAAADRRKNPAGEVVELVLYVSANSLACARAIQTLRDLIPPSSPGVKLTICDLSAQPSAGEDDNVVFTPTLVKRRPPPRTWILGDLSQPEKLGQLLDVLSGAN